MTTNNSYKFFDLARFQKLTLSLRLTHDAQTLLQATPLLTIADTVTTTIRVPPQVVQQLVGIFQMANTMSDLAQLEDVVTSISNQLSMSSLIRHKHTTTTVELESPPAIPAVISGTSALIHGFALDDLLKLDEIPQALLDKLNDSQRARLTELIAKYRAASQAGNDQADDQADDHADDHADDQADDQADDDITLQ